MGGKVWNELPEFVQNSTNIGNLHIYKMYKLSIAHDKIDIFIFLWHFW